MKILKPFALTLLIASTFYLSAQDTRSQIPGFLQKAYFEVNAGLINYPFSEAQLESGYTLTQSVVVPHAAARIVLFGYEFNKYLSVQITYMRPVSWIGYRYKNSVGIEGGHAVWMNIGGLTLKPSLPIGNKFSVYGEAGLGLITRHGFNDDITGDPVITSARYGTFLFGAGLKYQLNDHWGFQLCSNYSPENAKNKQPYTSFIGTGFTYRFSKFTDKQLKKSAETGIINPKQWVQIGYTSNVLGYGINNALEKACLFWGGDAEVQQGISINYQRNIFHAAKVFALDWGLNASHWQTTKNQETFFTLSIFPVFRINFLHSKPLDAYFYYSVAGPSYISKVMIDNENTGAHFTFQDTMGTGIFFGDKRNYNAEFKIGHYSNGNIFPSNAAVKIPLSLNVGYTF
jgi:hypothetical protein